MTSISTSHIILTQTQLIGSERLQRGWNPGPPHWKSRAVSPRMVENVFCLQGKLLVMTTEGNLVFRSITLSETTNSYSSTKR